MAAENTQEITPPPSDDEVEDVTAWGRIVIACADGDSVTKHDLVGDASVTVGRTSCAIVVPDKRISGKHCVLHRAAGGRELRVTDTSTNGTWVGGSKVGRGNSSLLGNGEEATLIKGDKACTLLFCSLVQGDGNGSQDAPSLGAAAAVGAAAAAAAAAAGAGLKRPSMGRGVGAGDAGGGAGAAKRHRGAGGGAMAAASSSSSSSSSSSAAGPTHPSRGAGAKVSV